MKKDLLKDSVEIDKQASYVFDTFEIQYHYDLIPMDDLDQDHHYLLVLFLC
jgi:hypothetical protein